MSKITLSEFLTCARPCRYDISVIVKAVIKSMKSGVQVMLDNEHILYDAYNGKVYMVKQGITLSNEKYKESADTFFKMLCSACRHAGDGTDMFMEELYAYVKKEEFDACMDAADRYIVPKGGQGTKNRMVYLLCIVTIVVYEVIFLSAMNIQFY
ncbi:MAG: hypothetical protein HFH14_03785 [Lachnospiraceae bacterium]|nr:hypothetical protein [Lachnospiraceae bacterium]